MELLDVDGNADVAHVVLMNAASLRLTDVIGYVLSPAKSEATRSRARVLPATGEA